jgi:RNA polymerase sigma factor (sigma-70 family)
MANDPLEDLCAEIAGVLNEQEGWHLPPAGIHELIDAVLPYVRHWCERAGCAPGIQDAALDPRCRARIEGIIRNYYRDGPMVEEMLTPGSADGERLWGEWRAYVLRIALYRKKLSPEKADDLVQTTFFQMKRALGNFRFESGLKTYYWNVFGNCYRQWLRDNQAPPEVELDTTDEEADEDAAGLKLPAPGPGPDEEVLRGEMQELITREIAAIVGSRDYTILSLYYLERDYVDPQTREKKKWTDKAIGIRLGGVPLNTITAWRHDALRRVRQYPGMSERLRELLDTEA